MKSLTKTTLSALTILAGSAGIASAQQTLIGAQFVLTGNPSYTGTGVLGESFVPYDGPGSGNLSDSENLGASGVTLSITDPSTNTNNYFENQTTSSTNFFENYLVIHNNPSLTFTFSGLTAGDNYDVALYAGDLGNRSGDSATDFTVNGLSVGGVGPTNGGGAFRLQPGTTPGNSLIVDNVTANGSGDIVILATNPGPSSYDEINGLSLESVPEPPTWVALLGGLGALVGFQGLRRRRV